MVLWRFYRGVWFSAWQIVWQAPPFFLTYLGNWLLVKSFRWAGNRPIIALFFPASGRPVLMRVGVQTHTAVFGKKCVGERVFFLDPVFSSHGVGIAAVTFHVNHGFSRCLVSDDFGLGISVWWCVFLSIRPPCLPHVCLPSLDPGKTCGSVGNVFFGKSDGWWLEKSPENVIWGCGKMSCDFMKFYLGLRFIRYLVFRRLLDAFQCASFFCVLTCAFI